MSSRVVACMATYPPRYDMALRTMQTFGQKQVDELYLYVNDAGTRRDSPSWLGREPSNATVTLASNANGNLGDVGKFYHLNHVSPDTTVLLIDDDIEYPDGYAGRMACHVSEYDGRYVVGVHGCDIETLCTSYYGDGQTNKKHFAARVPYPRPVHLLGTGTVAFRRALLSGLTLRDFPTQNMADLWLAAYCQKEEIGMVMVEREAGWLSPYPTPDDGIYERYKNDDIAQTFIATSVTWTHNAHIKP